MTVGTRGSKSRKAEQRWYRMSPESKADPALPEQTIKRVWGISLSMNAFNVENAIVATDLVRVTAFIVRLHLLIVKTQAMTSRRPR